MADVQVCALATASACSRSSMRSQQHACSRSRSLVHSAPLLKRQHSTNCQRATTYSLISPLLSRPAPSASTW